MVESLKNKNTLHFLILLALMSFAVFMAMHYAFKASAVVTDGSNAVDLLGQYDGASLTDPQPIYTKGGVGIFNDGPNRLGFNGIQGGALDTVHHRLFLADSSNHRVLVYNLNNDNTLPDRVPDYVLGQSGFGTNAGATTQSGMNGPRGLAYDSVNNRLFVAQYGSNRVTVYDVASITNGENAINVLGQPNFTSSSPSATQSRMSAPRDVSYDGINNRLFVADSSNNRVLVFDVGSITDGENAVNVLGQPDFTTNSAGATQAKMTAPYGVAYDSANNRLFVAEVSNQRVTVYDVAAITDGENAVNVLGQSTFTGTSTSFNAGGINGPQGVLYDSVNNRLFVSQFTSNRVTVFDVAAITDGENAVNVLGQSTFSATSSNVTQAGMNNPHGMIYDSGNNRLYVTQSSNNRVSVFDVASISDGENAVDLLGQYDGVSLTDPQPVYTKGSAHDAPNRLGFNSAQNIVIDSVHHRLFLADTGNNRVLVYNLDTDDTLLDRIPDYVLGQSNFYSNTNSGATQAGLTNPRGLAYDGVNNRLFVAEPFFHRVKVYDVASITNGENAVNVLGQTNFTNNGSANTQSRMNTPQALAYDETNQRLFVAQSGNHRVTVYDVAAITDGENAINVLGQPDFTSFSAANTQAGMNTPQGLAYDSANNRLFVSQIGNHRVTVYDVAAITDGENAISVLGQTNFTATSSANTQAGMNSPQGLAYDAEYNRLFVPQSGNNRVTVYDVAAITDGENAVNVLGQSNYTGFGQLTTQSGMYSPQAAFYDAANNRLWVADYGNSRATAYDVSLAGFTITESDGSTAVSEGGATDTFTVVLTGPPASDVVLNISSADTSAATVDLATLTFTNANWNTPQTVTVTAPEDPDAASETPVITVAVDDALSDNDFDLVPDQTVNVTVTDNDSINFSITESDGSTAVTEGGATDSFDVVLLSQPASDVVFDVSSSDTSSATVDLATLTFTDANWDTPQTVTVTAPQDPNAVSETPVITVAVNDASSDDAWDALSDQTVNVTVTDNDSINFAITESDGSTAVTEGGTTDSFTVVLLSQPASDVVFDVSSNDTSSATVDLATLTFTDANWDTPQTVTVAAPEDPDAVSEIPVITVAVNDASSDDAWDALPDQMVNVVVTDNDSINFSITESSGSTTVTEGGATDSFDVVLLSQPSTNVVFDIVSNDTSAATVNFATLTFTSANWDTPQTVTVTAPEDDNIVSEIPVITVSINAASSDNAWDFLPSQTVNVSVIDNDAPGFSIIESDGSTTVTEGGATDSFMVVLTVQPSSDVVFDVFSDNTSSVTVDLGTLTFTNANWNSPQTITVSAQQDDNVVGETVNVLVDINEAASDDAFDALLSQSIAVSVVDDDSPGFSITESDGSTAVAEGGAADSFTVVLTAQPSSDVVFDVSSNNTASATVDPASLTFTAGNWDTPQTVTVTAPDDSNVVSENVIVTVAVNDTASDGDWDPLANQAVSVTVTDNDTAGFSVTESSGSTTVTEGGATDSFTVALTAQPSSDVVFDVSSNDPSAATVNPATLTFTNANWDTPQTITVTAPEDFDSVAETPTITIAVNDAASDDDWDAVADQIVNVTVVDNDAPGFSITESGGSTTVAEGGATDSFTVVLTVQPSSDVVLNVASSDTSAATVNIPVLTFTDANWNNPQTITIMAEEDTDTDSETPSITVSINAASSDDAFDGVADQTFIISVIDNDEEEDDGGPSPAPSPTPPEPALVPVRKAGSSGGFMTSSPKKTVEEEEEPVQPRKRVAVFPDTEDHWAKSYIRTLSEECEIQGYSRGDTLLPLFAPDRTISRAEFIKTLVTCKHFLSKEKNVLLFKDITEDSWYADYIKIAKDLGIIIGYPDDTFRPNQPITREEALKAILLLRYSETEIPEGRPDFADVFLNQWYTKYIYFAQLKGYISGYPNTDGRKVFGLTKAVTRAEAAKMFVSILEL